MIALAAAVGQNRRQCTRQVLANASSRCRHEQVQRGGEREQRERELS